LAIRFSARIDAKEKPSLTPRIEDLNAGRFEIGGAKKTRHTRRGKIKFGSVRLRQRLGKIHLTEARELLASRAAGVLI
jgi:hypothetical protein